MSNKWEIETSLEPIAIIGMAGRFPGAKNIDEFWQNLRNGVESVSFFTDEELLVAGVDSALLSDHNYVKANGVLSDIEMFDASFFDFTPREAEVTDPQHRLFLECAWEALENAGWTSEVYEGRIGVYAGAGLNSYLLQNLNFNSETSNITDIYRLLIGNDKDFVSTRVSFQLNLKGPSVNVSTACSTSLVAVQMGCQSLLNYQCDMVLAGGVSIRVQQKSGYLYQEGMILSPDGHCRAFDAKAKGTIGGNGVGIVVLKRLGDALTDGDCIHAIIKGSAINNDGSLKVGYTAPSVDGQADVISEALALAEIEAETITYVEAHGTGTPLGDPIEIAALKQAFSASTQKKGYCAIGSLKTNIGHLDAAAGVAGLIKTALALKHQQIPPSLHFEKPNPEIDFANSPFYVNGKLCEWKTNGTPRRAGVSSFGIGGTNAHVVLEEAPSQKPSGKSRPWHLLLLSAKTATALDAATINLAKYLEQHREINLADVAYTLSKGRKAFSHRRILVCQDLHDAHSTLTSLEPQRVLTQYQELSEPSVVFMFPGQGTQYVNMAVELYREEPTFRDCVDKCSEILKPHLGIDLRHVLYPNKSQTEAAVVQLQQTAITQPALFVIDYALSQLWMSWGIRPAAMIGHSIGEYVAACLAGVFSLEDASVLVAARGQLMQQLPSGAMLAVPLSEKQVQPLLGNQLSLAAINGSSLCVVSGVTDDIKALQNHLRSQGIECRRLHTSHGFHSAMMQPMIKPFTQLVQKINLKPPQIPYISNLTGTWIQAEEIINPEYWAKHLRYSVRFAEGLQQLLTQPTQILLEVGPGRTLSQLAKQHPEQKPEQVVLTSVRHPRESISDQAFILTTFGKLWLCGVQVDWSEFYTNQSRHRLPLPTYPFERQSYWIEPAKLGQNERITQMSLCKKPDIADWFYLPLWKQSVLPITLQPENLVRQLSNYLVFIDECGLGSQLVEQLQQQNQRVITIKIGSEFTKLGEYSYCLNPQDADNYHALIQELTNQQLLPHTIVHLWSVTPISEKQQGLAGLNEVQETGFYSLLFLAQALGKQTQGNEFEIKVISNNMQPVIGCEVLCPEKATILGAVKVIPQEYSNINCCSIDVVLPTLGSWQEEKLIEELWKELTPKSADRVVAYRGLHRWVQTFEPIHLEEINGEIPRLKEKGIYLITGGLGGIGLVVAEYLAKAVQGKLILTGRSAFPHCNEWEKWLSTHDETDNTSCKIRKLQELTALGSEVLVASADVANLEQMQDVISQAQKQFGMLNGVIHAAGVADNRGVIHRRTRDLTEETMSPKLRGTLVLDSLCQDIKLDFLVLFSSIGTILYNSKFGQVGYCASNDFLDTFAYYNNYIKGTFTIAINWDDWQKVGMSVEAMQQLARNKNIPDTESLLKDALLPSEGINVFRRILSSNFPRISISNQNLMSRIEHDKSNNVLLSELILKQSNLAKFTYPRPELISTYVAPRNETEQKLTDIWQEILRFEQIGIYDNFFELGGDSLLTIQVRQKLQETFKKSFSTTDLFEYPTISTLAVYIDQEQVEQSDFQQVHSRVKKRKEAMEAEIQLAKVRRKTDA